ncbi:MAG: hypothetical protein WCK73_07545 [Deltaproteobacteria bacterium]
MLPFALGVLFAVPVTLGIVALRSWRLRNAQDSALAEQVQGMASRIEVVEAESTRTSVRMDVAETVLLEKGVADEEDLEEARRYFEANTAARYDRQRDGSLH